MIFIPLNSCFAGETLFVDKKDFEVLKIVHSYGDPNWYLHSHYHIDQAEILYVAAGKGTYTAANTPFRVEKGDLVIFNPNVVHSVESDSREPLDVWSCSVRGFQLVGQPANTILPPHASLCYHIGAQQSLIENIYHELFAQGQNRKDGYAAICSSLAMVLLCLCVQVIRLNTAQSPEAGDSIAPEVIAYLDEHYMEDITMEKLTKIFHMSASYISHEVKRIYHTSPINYMIDRRICAAQWQLASTNRTLKDISLSVGYENVSHFSNMFSGRVGVKPLEFRMRYTEQRK